MILPNRIYIEESKKIFYTNIICFFAGIVFGATVYIVAKSFLGGISIVDAHSQKVQPLHGPTQKDKKQAIEEASHKCTILEW